jgi:hypothetical protein
MRGSCGQVVTWTEVSHRFLPNDSSNHAIVVSAYAALRNASTNSHRNRHIHASIHTSPQPTSHHMHSPAENTRCKLTSYQSAPAIHLRP